ncbi:pyruvate dehydrogenase E1 component, alpha subunit [delta proteobacterium NaphS2]|nr:pyruvate dehydrogenase E1 component, alpha subunit [delta proteobacterium NaphS2]
MDHLSILNEEGELDKELEPEIPEDLLLKLYRFMVLGRKFDDRLLSLQRQGRMGTFAPISGQEAAHLGAVALLRPSDWFVPSFRETGAELWRGRSMESVILGFAGYAEAASVDNVGEDGHGPMNNMPVSIPVASQVLHAVGIAWGMRYRKKDDVAMAFFGDGGTSEGDFHEGLNFAGVYQCPVIFVCQNNHWAISTPREKQTRSKTLAQKALAYGMPGIQVDGNDVLAVYAAAEEAVARARSGEGPSMIECITYRMKMHTTADDPKRYRKEEEVAAWQGRDPIPRFRKYLTDKGLLSDDKIQEMESDIEEEIKSAVKRAEGLMAEFTDPLRMFDHVYAKRPPYLEAQRKELEEEIKRAGDEDRNGKGV